jgi:glucokinase
MVTLGTGIGGGFVQGGRLVTGAHGFAGELGHMVIEQHGPVCPCGRRGCWERYASGAGLARLAREAARAGRIPVVVALAGHDVEAVRGEHVTRAALEGDEGAREVLAELGGWVANGLANVIAALDPEIVVIGGGLVEAGELVVGPAREALAGLLLGAEHRPPVPLVAAALGPRAGAMGAALL